MIRDLIVLGGIVGILGDYLNDQGVHWFLWDVLGILGAYLNDQGFYWFLRGRRRYFKGMYEYSGI